MADLHAGEINLLTGDLLMEDLLAGETNRLTEDHLAVETNRLTEDHLAEKDQGKFQLSNIDTTQSMFRMLKGA